MTVAGCNIDDHYTDQHKVTQSWHKDMKQSQTDLEQPPTVHRPIMSNEGLPATHPVEARDEYGDPRDLHDRTAWSERGNFWFSGVSVPAMASDPDSHDTERISRDTGG